MEKKKSKIEYFIFDKPRYVKRKSKGENNDSNVFK